jgi:hypothetical protein
MNDTELLNFLEQCEGCALISDDFGNWAVSGTGMQNVPEKPGEPSDIESVFFVEADEWKPSIREAIAAVMEETS